MMSHSHNKITILMADDNKEDCLQAKEALEKSRVTNPIRFVHNGEDLLAYLYQKGAYKNAPQPGLILLDFDMLHKNGRKALGEIKNDPDLQGIPVVILADKGHEIDSFESDTLGAKSYITKPLSFQGLAKIVQMLKRYWFEIVDIPTGD